MSKFDIAKFAASLEQPRNKPRDIETITAEIVQLKQDAGNAILGIGQRLNEAKSLLSDGEWLAWLAERVDFSPRTAQRFMRLAREWSDATALSQLGATKALTLLALPPEERDAFLAETHSVNGEEKSVIDMTSRELEKAIRERDEARRDVETALAEAEAAEESRAKMQEDMEQLKALQEAAQQDAEQARADLEAAQKELEDLQAKPVEIAVEKVVDEKAVQQARVQAVKEMQAKVDKAEAGLKTAEKKLEDLRKEAQANAEILSRAEKAERELAETRRQLEEAARTERKNGVNQNGDMALFNLLFTQTQENINRMHGLRMKLAKADGDLDRKLKAAINALLEAVKECGE